MLALSTRVAAVIEGVMYLGPLTFFVVLLLRRPAKNDGAGDAEG